MVAGFGQTLQSRRQIRGFTDDRLLLGSTFADQVANDDETGGDTHAGLERLTGGRLQPGNGGDHVETGAHRTLGIVLVRAPEAEIGQDAVAHEFANRPLVGEIGRDHSS